MFPFARAGSLNRIIGGFRNTVRKAFEMSAVASSMRLPKSGNHLKKNAIFIPFRAPV